MDYTDTLREEIKAKLEGYSPDDIAVVFYDELVTLLENDPNYFANGCGNSLTRTLEWTARLVENSSAVKTN